MTGLWWHATSSPITKPSAASIVSGPDNKQWYAKTIRNTANMAWFSSDRTIREYANDIWDVPTNEA